MKQREGCHTRSRTRALRCWLATYHGETSSPALRADLALALATLWQAGRSPQRARSDPCPKPENFGSAVSVDACGHWTHHADIAIRAPRVSRPARRRRRQIRNLERPQAISDQIPRWMRNMMMYSSVPCSFLEVMPTAAYASGEQQIPEDRNCELPNAAWTYDRRDRCRRYTTQSCGGS